jgi:hypothetical protein
MGGYGIESVILLSWLFGTEFIERGGFIVLIPGLRMHLGVERVENIERVPSSQVDLLDISCEALIVNDTFDLRNE